MRVNHQLHGEFAIVLYGRPLQIKEKPDKHTLPIARSYAHLVRKILFIAVDLSSRHPTHLIDNWCKDTVQFTIPRGLQIGTELMDISPNTKRVRLVITSRDLDRLGSVRPQSEALTHKLRDQKIAIAEQAIRAYQAVALQDRPFELECEKISHIPPQLELVEQQFGDTGHFQTIEDTPFCEAFRKVWDEQPPPTWTTVKITTETTTETSTGTTTVITTTTTRTKSATVSTT